MRKDLKGKVLGAGIGQRHCSLSQASLEKLVRNQNFERRKPYKI